MTPVETQVLQIGKQYVTRAGNKVTVTKENTTPGYETVCGDDGRWRYNREGDRGRCTGTNHDGSNPNNIVPEPIALPPSVSVDL